MSEKQDVGQVISFLNNKMRRVLDQLANRNQISGSQSRILIYILVESTRREVFQKDIEEKYSIRPATATGLLKQLEKSELIVRVPLPQDRRQKIILPTKKAQTVQKSVLHEIQRLEAKLTENISDKDLAVFYRVAHHMSDNLTQFYMQEEGNTIETDI